MTEQEWLDCGKRLSFLADRLSVRQACLFAVACCERIEGLLLDGRSRGAVAALRRFADGRADPEEMEREARDASRAAASAVRAACIRALGAEEYARLNRPILSSGPGPFDLVAAGDVATNAAWAVEMATGCAQRPRSDTVSAVQCATNAAKCAAQAVLLSEGRRDERFVQCELLRDIAGPDQTVSLDPVWLAWDGGVVGKLAQAIYDRHGFGDLPVLADALEDAGCTDDDLVAHCRGGGPHVRGCWVVDRILAQ